MMQEINNDTNGDYDFVADAKQADISGASSLTQSFSSSASSGMTTPQSSATPAPPVSNLVHGNLSAAPASAPKPSYEFPPGVSPPPFLLNRPSDDASKLPVTAPVLRHPNPVPSLPSSSLSNVHQPVEKPTEDSSKQASLADIFGADVLAKLPPLNPAQPSQLPNTSLPSFPSALSNPPRPQPTLPTSFTPTLPSSFAPTSAMTPVSVPSAGFLPPSHPTFAPQQSSGYSPTVSAASHSRSQVPAPVLSYPDQLSSQQSTFTAPPPRMPILGSTVGANPFSSQAAGSHLPSFSGLPGAAPPSGPNPVPSAIPPFMPQLDTSVPPQLMNIPPSTAPIAEQQSQQMMYSGYDQPPPMTYSGAPNSYVGLQQNQSYGGMSGSSYGEGGQGRSWWAQTSLDTLKNVTEKAKSTVYSLVTTLDPQMKMYTSTTGPSGGPQTDLTLFYIGNEVNMVNLVKSALEPVFRNVHIYTRSGAAPGHKQQIGFSNALNAARMTLQLAQSTPAIQSTMAIAVEPFVVELFPNSWFASSCVLLSEPSKGAEVYLFSQLTPLPEGLVALPAGEQMLTVPLDDLVARFFPGASRDNWMEHLTGTSWGSTVALAVRQLFGIYKKKFMYA